MYGGLLLGLWVVAHTEAFPGPVLYFLPVLPAALTTIRLSGVLGFRQRFTLVMSALLFGWALAVGFLGYLSAARPNGMPRDAEALAGVGSFLFSLPFQLLLAWATVAWTNLIGLLARKRTPRDLLAVLGRTPKFPR